MKTVVVIPTYNEKQNVKEMAQAVLEHLPGNGVILFVDDNSPDGTGDLIDEMASRSDRIQCLHREKKEGLGRAYVSGFTKALEMGADLIIEMDCDFSHDPAMLPKMIEETKNADVVIGSRYVPGGKCVNWPFHRLLISKAGGIFVRTITGMPIKDPTGGFKCFRRSVLEKIDLSSVESSGYSFQLEMNHRTWMAGFKIKEIPITFAERRAGYSKITAGIAVESVKMVLKLSKSVGFRRKPKK
jgi:dolichol-phosphate mannosyltransferase